MKRLPVLILLCLLLGCGAPVMAEDDSCAELGARLDAMASRSSADLRRLHREIAALRADVEAPGLSEAMAGIGYICGLFGVACLVASRRKKE